MQGDQLTGGAKVYVTPAWSFTYGGVTDDVSVSRVLFPQLHQFVLSGEVRHCWRPERFVNRRRALWEKGHEGAASAGPEVVTFWT